MRYRPEVQTSKWNHGDEPHIICTVTTDHEIRFHAEDIVKMLRIFASDEIAKILNEMGKQIHISDLCGCVNDLDDNGRALIDNLTYFTREHERSQK